MDDTTLTWLVPLSCFVVVAGLIVVIIFVMLRQKKARRANLERLGFSPSPPADPNLAARIERIYRHRTSQRIKVVDPHRRAVQDGELTLFDLVDTAATENSQLGSNLLGVTSPRLNLPYFALLPWAGSQGSNVAGGLASLAAGAAQNVLDWAMRQAGVQKITVPDNDEFNRGYSLYGKDQAAVLDFLTPERITALLELGRRYEIQAAGDFFTMKMGLEDGKQTFTFNTQPDTMLRDAARLIAILSA